MSRESRHRLYIRNLNLKVLNNMTTDIGKCYGAFFLTVDIKVKTSKKVLFTVKQTSICLML